MHPTINFFKRIIFDQIIRGAAPSQTKGQNQGDILYFRKINDLVPLKARLSKNSFYSLHLNIYIRISNYVYHPKKLNSISKPMELR
ncbi:MAG: hypothetical protein EBV97_12155 [Rhodobacteraceae bacterium]|nr:hypothetical protein [Paracoccaceae bacterium]